MYNQNDPLTEVANRIRARIKEKREQEGHTKKDLAKHVHQYWGIGEKNAYLYIHELEETSAIYNLQWNYPLNGGKYNDTLDMSQHRIPDYLASLGAGWDEMMQILDGIETIQPEFRLVKSKVRALKA